MRCVAFVVIRDFLETLYGEISQYQLRTEKNDVSGTLTSEMWMDLQLQTHINPEQGFMITTSFRPDTLQVRAAIHCHMFI
jgi:hypothetical protein